MSSPVIVGYNQIASSLKRDSKHMIVEARAAASQTARDPLIADSLVGEFNDALAALERVEVSSSVMSSPHNAMAAALQSWLSSQALGANRVEESSSGVLEVKFAHDDWAGWVKSFFSWYSRITKAAFVTPAVASDLQRSKLRIAVFGDWGTGMYGAPIIAQTIASRGDFDLVLHLGDVYYAGTKDEERNRALGLWPKVKGARNCSLNSNHEMYSGGHGYFEELLGDKTFIAHTGSSCFALMTNCFVIVGLDTAYEEHDIFKPELDWLEEIFSVAGRRKAVFFSHHQPFSALDVQGPKLQAKLGRYLNEKRIFAWYWGHEHRCVIYDKQPLWDMHGRCLGHAGFPEARGSISRLEAAHSQEQCWRSIPQKLFSPAAIVLDGPNQYITDEPDKFLPHGFMTLELADNTITEYVHSPTGEMLYSALLTAVVD